MKYERKGFRKSSIGFTKKYCVSGFYGNLAIAMKTLLFLCIAIALVTGCSKNSIESSSLTTKSALILEINKESSGNVNIIGKSLFLRLYENGTIEFDHPDNSKMKSGINKTEDIMTLQKAKISEQELKQFLSLLNSEDFKNTPDVVKRKCCCTDTSLSFEISSKVGNPEKRISLNGFCDAVEIINRDPRYAENLPKVMSDLVILARNAYVKYHPR